MTAFDYQLGTLGSEQLMSQNEAEFNYSLENLVLEQRLAGGILVRYKRAQMGHWRWSYRHIWGKKTYVYDGGLARDDLYALMQADAEMSYLTPSDQGLQLAYTVRFVANSWQEHLIYRSGDMWAWQLQFELVQVR